MNDLIGSVLVWTTLFIGLFVMVIGSMYVLFKIVFEVNEKIKDLIDKDF